MHIHSLHIYPVKSLAGHSVQTAELAQRGFVNDRRWMLVDENGRFISQRTHPILCRWQASVVGEDLVLKQLDTGEELTITNAQDENGEWLDVQVWNDAFKARLVSSVTEQQLSNYLGFNCRLVYLSENSHRPVEEAYAKAGEEVSFADGYPYLIANTASLKDLSQRHGSELSMERFRPNIVVAGEQAYEEDNWQQLKIGTSTFRLPKPCSRCNMITIDPQTADENPGVFQTLATYRMQERKVRFGMNACWEGTTMEKLQVGDTVLNV
ncbi:MAG: MOSC N-terminal beta barrel domain-containing protein [Bacteroidota bacterium]